MRRRDRRFRLATVLRVRKRQEEIRAQALAETKAVILGAQRERHELVELQRAMLMNADALTRDAFDAADVRQFFQYERHLAHRVVDADARIAEQLHIAEDRRAELEDASRNRKAIEKLEDRHRGHVAAAGQYWEQRTSDEIAAARAYIARRKVRT